MAGSFANYLEDEILDHIFSAATWTPPETLYVGLSTSTISDAGENITEPSGNGYARVAVTNNATNWPAASGGAKANGVAIEFPKATGSWGTITDFFISDANSGGNILCYGALTTSQAVSTDNILKFPIGDLDITLD